MPPTRREFARQFRALAPEGRAAFVAGLLALEGWDVTREGCRIVASGDGHRRVVHVGTPPTDAAVDEVVTVPSRLSVLVPGPWVSGRAGDVLPGVGPDRSGSPRGAPGGHSTVAPGTLHDRLCYAIDREDARTLYREHFETAFDAPPTDGGWSSRLPPRVLVGTGLLLVAVLALAGVPGGTGFGTPTGTADRATDRTAATPAGTPIPDVGTPRESAADRATPALFANGTLEDVDRLRRSHVAALSEPPVRMRATFRGPRHLTGFDTRRSGFDADDEVAVRIRVAGTDRYRVVRRTNFSGSGLTTRNATLDRFADGTTEYRRIGLDGDTSYERRPLSTVQGGTGTVADWSRLLVARYLNATERRVEVAPRGSGIRYRVISTGGARGLDHETRDYRAVAVVEPDGWVTALRVTYTHPHTGARVAVTAGFDRGPVAVDAPGWYGAVTTGSTPEP